MAARRLPALLVPAILVLSANLGADPDPPVTRADDAFHFSSFADGQHDGLYAEWWYFNVIDAERDVRMIFAYSVVDPANRSRLGLASVLAVVYGPGGTAQQLAAFTPEAFAASSDEADVTIGGGPAGRGRIEVEADDRYRITGAVAGAHRIAWSLQYTREGRPWFAADRREVGQQPWEQMSWLVYMPGASVSGTVTVDGTVHRVRGARGYHDHNWGEWIPGVVTWNWAEYSSPQVGVALGDFPRVDVGMVGVDFAGGRTVFDRSQYRIAHTGWTYDPVNKRRYPKRTWLRAENESTRIALRFDVVETEPIVPPLDLPIRPLIYEQTARVTGALWERDAEGAWQRRATFMPRLQGIHQPDLSELGVLAAHPQTPALASGSEPAARAVSSP
jgi:hypothetical protein